MKITILGCGTSTGVPVIGCNCAICTSMEPRNRRSRTSIIVEHDGNSVLIDTSSDFRYQMFKNKIKKIDTVLFTHVHADHIHGIDDIRGFNFIQKGEIPCYAPTPVVEDLIEEFPYIFSAMERGPANWVPNLTLEKLDDSSNLIGMEVRSIEVDHGGEPAFGYLFNRRFAYLTDCKTISEESKSWLGDLDVLVLGALRFEPHRKHMSIDEALMVVDELKPRRTIFTHLSHQVDYGSVNFVLPPRVELAYDSMKIEF